MSRKRSNGTTTATVLCLCVLLAIAAGCGGDATEKPAGPEPGLGSDDASAACALVVEYRGATYWGTAVQVLARLGEPVGTGVVPACDDGGGASPEEEAELVEIQGVSPDVAVGLRGQEDTVFVRDGIEEFPPVLEKLMRTPGCDSRDEPFELSGPWRGILRPGGHTEDDLVPPYDLELLVEETNVPRYDRAFLTVRVPPEAGEPLSRKDIRASLWEGGTIELSVECRGGRFVALGATAHPPP